MRPGPGSRPSRPSANSSGSWSSAFAPRLSGSEAEAKKSAGARPSDAESASCRKAGAAKGAEAISRRRLPLRKPGDQVDWLVRKGEQHGFVIPTGGGGAPDVATTALPRLTGKLNQPKKITVDAVRFDGHLVVTDPEAFTDALVNGIGRAKSYGCGLLSLAAARR